MSKATQAKQRTRRLPLAPWEKQLLKNSAAVILWDYRWTADKIATVLDLTLTQVRTLVLAYDNLPKEEQTR